jgi:hypothetical protein
MAVAKKTAPKKAVTKKEVKIKYSDKSAGQPELKIIFEALVKLLLPYNKGTIALSGGKDGKIILTSVKEIVIGERKLDEVWFVSALVQKGYVGFYYMPIYMNEPVKKKIQPELLKCLKGKACFHIKKLDAQLIAQIKDALRIGYACYKERGWV